MADGAAISASAEEWSVRGILIAIVAALVWVAKHQATRLAEVEKEREAERKEFQALYIKSLGKENE